MAKRANRKTWTQSWPVPDITAPNAGRFVEAVCLWKRAEIGPIGPGFWAVRFPSHRVNFVSLSSDPKSCTCACGFWRTTEPRIICMHAWMVRIARGDFDGMPLHDYVSDFHRARRGPFAKPMPWYEIGRLQRGRKDA